MRQNVRKLIETAIITPLNVISILYDIITLPLYTIIQEPKPWKIAKLKKSLKSKRIASTASSVTYKWLKKQTHIHKYMVQTQTNTMAHLLKCGCALHGHRKCAGTREVLAHTTEITDGKEFLKYKMGDYKWISYIELCDTAKNFGKGLQALGTPTKQNVAIFAPTRREWLIAANALFLQNIPLVTIYANLGNVGLVQALNETEVETIITTQRLLAKCKEILPQLPKVRTLIYMEDRVETPIPKGFSDNINILKFSTVVEMGQRSTEPMYKEPEPDDLAVIMYTNGSTGTPKGVLLSHANLIHTVKAFLDNSPDLRKNETIIAYLPLAHIFELLCEFTVIMMGCKIGYSSSLTLFDTSSKIMKGSKGDFSVLKPVHMTSVPLVLEAISKAIEKDIGNMNVIVRSLFKFFYYYKVKWSRMNYNTPILNRLIFSKIRNTLGGHLTSIVAGGSALSPFTHEELDAFLCLKIVQGYGLTETTACACSQDVLCQQYGTVGSPLPYTYLRLIDWLEGGYSVQDKPNPRGEVVIGGASVSSGYYKNEQLTKDDFFNEDGIQWFHTGDVGEVDELGVLRIIDRKKDMVKLQGGEFVSLGKVESILKMLPFISSIFLYAASIHFYSIAFIIPNEAQLRKFASTKKVFSIEMAQKVPLAELCANNQIKQAALVDLKTFGKRGLARYEIPQDIKLVTDEWTPENGLLTSAFKLRRLKLIQYYADDIEEMYKTEKKKMRNQ